MKLFNTYTELISLLLLFTTLNATQFISDQISSYKKIVNHFKPNLIGLDRETLQFLFNLHDDDAHCSDECVQFIREKLGNNLSWGGLEDLIESIYSGMISDDPYEPQEIKLALTDTIDSMKVMFITWGTLSDPFVEYSLTTSDKWISTPCKSFTYTVPQKWWPVFTGMIYEADMTGLEPSTQYKYRVGGYDSSNQTTRYSEEFQFKSAPVPHSTQKTTVGILADQGTWMLLGFMVTDKMNSMKAELGLDLTMIVGDISYAGLSSEVPALNISKEDEFERVWDLYGIQSQPLSSGIPFMVGNGNHERFYDWAGYKNRYKMPYIKSGGSPDGFWYSYDYGNAHWVSISSEHSLEDGSEQKNWLQNDLKKAYGNRAVVPWIIVSIHKPLYCSVEGTPQGYRELLEPLLLEFDVDLVFSGHMHAYERIHPVENYVVTSYPVKGTTSENAGMDVYESTGKGPVHVVQGNTGAMQFETYVQPQPAWSALRFSNGYIPRNKTHHPHDDRENLGVEGVILPSNYTDTFGFGVATFYNSSHMLYKMIPVTGTIGTDSFWIVKKR